MPKYIRTKDGKIYEVEKEFAYDIVVKCKELVNGNLVIHKSMVVKQADTLEELCDDFVLIRQEKELGETIRVFTRLELLLEFAICQWETDIIYGAIWTDKGLIYVAKMNEKGELELL